jgi:hypothetical protein
MMKNFFYPVFLMLFFAPLLKANEIMIDNFEATSNVNWDYLSDQVMGGVSEGSASLGIDSDSGNTYVQMTGDVSTENNGGFIQLRTRLPSGVGQDVSGVYLRARGNSQKYFIHLRTRGTMLPWQYYQAEFDVSEDWQIFRLPLTVFKPSGSWLGKSPSPRSIRSLGIVAYGRDHKAIIDVDEIGFYE